MKNNKAKEFLNLRSRRIIHYSLIICILLIQIIIAAFFYNEFIRKKNSDFIEVRLREIESLENITDNSRKELLISQENFQKYLTSNDQKYLDLYFESANKLTKNFDSINIIKDQNPDLKSILNSKKSDQSKYKQLKDLIDSTHQITSSSNFTVRQQTPQFKKYRFDSKLDTPFTIETQIYKDTVTKKKKLIGRLGDAISGKENVKKESIVVTLKKNGKITSPFQMKNEMDSLVSTINNHYTEEVKKIYINNTKNNDDTTKFHQIFNNLSMYSNSIMTIYETAIKDAKATLQSELEKQNSKTNKIRSYLILGSMILMFIVSVLIMLLTKIAFTYEQKLSSANQQINENLKFKNRILGMLSHELRTPLKIIGIFINRINKKTDDETIKEHLKSISFTNDTLLMHSNQILEYTKNQHFENKLIPVVFNLKKEIRSILDSIQPYIETRNNSLIISENIDSDIEVFTDNTKINQVFMNILGNANKFTENGQINVNINTQRIDDNTITLFSEINDTGSGIAESDLKKIFEPYYQGILSHDIENIGAGLGLSLCKEIIELYNGEISVSSIQNKGTKVNFHINLNINQ